jgi:1,2-dihydroxy-3-keto-5-methylthiopentene dioxygenase
LDDATFRRDSRLEIMVSSLSEPAAASMSGTASPRTTLRVFHEARPDALLRELTEGAKIVRELAAIGVRFERFNFDHPVIATEDQTALLDAYREVVERVRQVSGYVAVDVVRVVKGTPNRESIRKTFCAEHRHLDDEVRYFVEGSGAFYLRPSGHVYMLICVRGDFLSLPAGARHWFDMGPDPDFTAIRWFNTTAGWVPQYTGDTIAERFPPYE